MKTTRFVSFLKEDARARGVTQTRADGVVVTLTYDRLHASWAVTCISAEGDCIYYKRWLDRFNYAKDDFKGAVERPCP